MSNCPYCNFEGAYNSGFTVECPNPKCKCFSVKQCSEWVTNEIRRRIEQTFNGGYPGRWPEPFDASNPEPTMVAISFPEPQHTYDIVLTFDFGSDTPFLPKEAHAKHEKSSEENTR
jgi:hypothetical protein